MQCAITFGPTLFAQNRWLIKRRARLRCGVDDISRGNLIAHRACILPVQARSLTEKPCGDEEIRTPDILLAKQALYQLSYVPAGSCFDVGVADTPLVGTQSRWASLVSNLNPVIYRSETGGRRRTVR
jgi:hypothetical protein